MRRLRNLKYTSTEAWRRCRFFLRAGSIVPEQPLVQSTEEKPEGPPHFACLSTHDLRCSVRRVALPR